MANAPCARLTKFIKPSVTDSPTLIRNSSMPEAMPSKTIVMVPPAGPGSRAGRQSRVLWVDRLEGFELDVLQHAVDAFELADVLVLDDVARLRVDLDRAARARPLQALGGGDEGVTAGVAVGLLQRLVDQVHAVVGAHRHEVRPVVLVGLGVGRGEGLVLRRVMGLLSHRLWDIRWDEKVDRDMGTYC